MAFRFALLFTIYYVLASSYFSYALTQFETNVLTLLQDSRGRDTNSLPSRLFTPPRISPPSTTMTWRTNPSLLDSSPISHLAQLLPWFGKAKVCLWCYWDSVWLWRWVGRCSVIILSLLVLYWRVYRSDQGWTPPCWSHWPQRCWGWIPQRWLLHWGITLLTPITLLFNTYPFRLAATLYTDLMPPTLPSMRSTSGSRRVSSSATPRPSNPGWLASRHPKIKLIYWNHLCANLFFFLFFFPFFFSPFLSLPFSSRQELNANKISRISYVPCLASKLFFKLVM